VRFSPWSDQLGATWPRGRRGPERLEDWSVGRARRRRRTVRSPRRPRFAGGRVHRTRQRPRCGSARAAASGGHGADTRRRERHRWNREQDRDRAPTRRRLGARGDLAGVIRRAPARCLPLLAVPSHQARWSRTRGSSDQPKRSASVADASPGRGRAAPERRAREASAGRRARRPSDRPVTGACVGDQQGDSCRARICLVGRPRAGSAQSRGTRPAVEARRNDYQATERLEIRGGRGSSSERPRRSPPGAARASVAVAPAASSTRGTAGARARGPRPSQSGAGRVVCSRTCPSPGRRRGGAPVAAPAVPRGTRAISGGVAAGVCSPGARLRAWLDGSAGRFHVKRRVPSRRRAARQAGATWRGRVGGEHQAAS